MQILTDEELHIISTSSYFDDEWYLAQYPGIKEGYLKPAEHYLYFGANEMRDPGPFFSTRWYLAQYPDVSVMKINPLVHFMRFGEKEGRFPSPYKLLRTRIVETDGYVKKLLNDCLRSRAVRPEKAISENWLEVKPQWIEYYLYQGAVAYGRGNINEALQSFKSAIQISPDAKDGYVLYHYVFYQLNRTVINLFERSYSDARLMVAHISCRPRVALAESSALSFNDQSKQIANVIVVGDPDLPENKFDFNPELNLLKVPSSDFYEGLPLKVRQLYLFLGLTSLEAAVLKIDDNIRCKNMDNLKRDLDEVIAKHDYGGGVIIPQGPFFASTFWHLNKCADPKINERPDGLLFLAPYATGPIYWIRDQTVKALSKMALIHERFFETEIYEDRVVGTVLAYYGFSVHRFNLTDSGSLESTDGKYY